MKLLRLACLFGAIATTVVPALVRAQPTLKNQFPSLSFTSPVGLYNAGDGSNRLFVLEQPGVIRVFQNNPATTVKKTFLDIHDSVYSGASECGLLGLAFHPNYATNHYFYVDYTMNNPLRTVISRFTTSATNPDSAIRSSEVIILTQLQPYDNHNGGQLAFGPDGYLYISFGDGGSGNDPLKNGQSKTTLLGKILRINIDSTAGGQNYTIPPTNPFVDSTGLKKEIYTFGMRNTWRFSFDNQKLWAADVGQNRYEEIDTLQNGMNYGWRNMEGFHVNIDVDTTGFSLGVYTPPIWEYTHDSGRCSITGGFVYHGSTIPQIAGRYVYADYCTGEIWALDARTPSMTNIKLLNNSTPISSFGLDEASELYACGNASGKIYLLTLKAPGTTILISPSSGTINTSRTPALVWHPGLWATVFRLQVSTDSTFASAAFDDSTLTDTVKTLPQLAPATKYFWRVRSQNSGGIGPYSTIFNFTTLNDQVPPAPPALVSPAPGAQNVPGTCTFVWTRPIGTSYFRLQVSGDSTFASTVVDDTTITDTTATEPGLAFGQTFFWRVSARNSAGTSPFSTARSFTVALYSASYHMQKGWNLISIPVIVPDPRKTTLFPGAVSNAFAYNPGGSYVTRDSLFPGIGYWVKFPDSTSVIIAGTPIIDDTLDISAGWNMIGTTTYLLPADSVIQIPPGFAQTRYFGYSGIYVDSPALLPSQGYWVKATAPGQLVIHSTGTIEFIIRPRPTRR